MISSSEKVCETLHENINEVSSELDDKEDTDFIRDMENKKFRNLNESNSDIDINNGNFERICTEGEISGYIVAEGSDIEAPKINTINRPDSCSIASFSSVSSSSSISSIGLSVESMKKANLINQNQNNDSTSLEISNNNNNNNHHNHHPNNNSNIINNSSNNNDNGFHPMVHQKIRRVPSTANPKHRVPNLLKNQRSKSQPYVHVNHLIHQQRRNSSPSNLSGRGITNKYTKTMKQVSSLPNFSSTYNQQPQDSSAQPQQQIIYLQIPQPSQTQLSDPQALQQQISSQLQLLVPQIYNQLVSQIYSKSNNSGTVNMTINQNISKDGREESVGKCSSKSNVLTEKNLCQNSNDQQFQQTPSTHHQPQSFHESHINVEDEKNADLIDFSQILQHFPLENLEKSRNSYIEIQRHPGTPKIIIPITEELILQCQQLQQYKESFMPYQPKLETILEESLSVKHLKMSKFSKTKIVACVLTVLCVIVVVLLAGDKTIAVAVVASVFILFLIGSTFYLYTHSNKREIESNLSRAESARLQINEFANRNSSHMV